MGSGMPNNMGDERPEFLSALSSGARVKLPKIEIDGENHPFGDIFLDIPLVLSLISVKNKVSIIIETSVSFDGLSIRKLDLGDVRTNIRKNKYKASQRERSGLDFISAGKDFSEFGFNLLGTGYLNNFVNFTFGFFKRSHDGENIYKSSLFIDKKHVGSSTFNINKNNGGGGTLPNISSTCHIELISNQEGDITYRINVPLSGLSRDNARGIVISVRQNVKVLVDDFEVFKEKFSHELKLGSVTYQTLASV